MFRLTRRPIITLAALLAVASPAVATAGGQAEGRPPSAREPQRHPPTPPERQGKPREPAAQSVDRDSDRDRDRDRRVARPVAPRVVVGGQVFIGGYFYDPFYGAYPWWPRTAYPYWYVPTYDRRAELRVKVTPKDAAVYVDGFYAGLVDEFDGVFQALPLPPGGHRLMLYRPGYRTARYSVYLRRGSVFTLRAALELLGPGERAELPPTYTRVPVPPQPGSYRVPVERWPAVGTPEAAPEAPVPTGGLTIVLQPAGARIVIDGEQWFSSEPGRLATDLPAGTHRIGVSSPGYVPAELDVTVVEGEPQTIHVNLVPVT